jgi:hypothetical protein
MFQSLITAVASGSSRGNRRPTGWTREMLQIAVLTGDGRRRFPRHAMHTLHAVWRMSIERRCIRTN